MFFFVDGESLIFWRGWASCFILIFIYLYFLYIYLFMYIAFLWGGSYVLGGVGLTFFCGGVLTFKCRAPSPHFEEDGPHVFFVFLENHTFFYFLCL